MNNFSRPEDIVEIVERLGNKAHDLAGRNILITGGRGFLGRYFTEVFTKLNAEILAEPAHIVILDNLITSGPLGASIPDAANIEFIEHDASKPFESEKSFDYIIHAAGIASPFYYRAHPLETLDVAISGTRALLDLARKDAARITFFSSSEIYGDPDSQHMPIQESYRGNVNCQGPRACYDESKRVGETLCYVYHEYFGVHTNTIRPFNVYGPGMQETDYRVLPNFANRLKAQMPFHVYGSGQQTRTFCYITDAMVGFLSVILGGTPGEAYNIGNPKPEISVEGLIATIEEVLGHPIERQVTEHPDSYPADEPQRRCPDVRKARLQLGYDPQVPLNVGLERFLAWTDENYIGVV